MSDDRQTEIYDPTGEAYPAEEPLTKGDVRQLKVLRESRDKAKAAADAAEAEYREWEAICWEKMENAGDTSTTKVLPDGTKLQIVRRGTIYSRVLDNDVLLDSLEQEGRVEELTKPGFQKQRLNEYVRTCLESGVPLPDGLDFYERRYLTLTEK
jgi:hypothetical protein